MESIVHGSPMPQYIFKRFLFYRKPIILHQIPKEKQFRPQDKCQTGNRYVLDPALDLEWQKLPVGRNDYRNIVLKLLFQITPSISIGTILHLEAPTSEYFSS